MTHLRSAVAMAVATLLLAAHAAVPVAAQTSSPASGTRVVFLVQNPRQIETVVRTSIGMREGRGIAADSVTVIFCGDAVTSLVSATAQGTLLSEAASKGVRLVACGISIQQKQIALDQLVREVAVVDNGLLEIVRLKLDGYISIEL